MIDNSYTSDLIVPINNVTGFLWQTAVQPCMLTDIWKYCLTFFSFHLVLHAEKLVLPASAQSVKWWSMSPLKKCWFHNSIPSVHNGHKVDGRCVTTSIKQLYLKANSWNQKWITTKYIAISTSHFNGSYVPKSDLTRKIWPGDGHKYYSAWYDIKIKPWIRA